MPSLPDRPVRILHVHSTFDLGGKEARSVRLMNAFGDAASHVVLSATGKFGARDAIDPAVTVDFPAGAPSLVGKPGPLRYRRLAEYMRGFDLVLSYNWGAMDVVAARRLCGGPPLIHHEDGFNEDEAERLNPKRNFFRKTMLPAAYRLVVPSERLEQIAREVWRRPDSGVLRIPNGIEVDRYAAPRLDHFPGLARLQGPVIVGTMAGLRPVKNLSRLVGAFAKATEGDMDLVIVGEGPDRQRIDDERFVWGVEAVVHLTGFLPDPASYVGLFDIFALSSDSEQFPISLLEAMAAGLACVCTAVGDVSTMVASENLPFIVAPGDDTAFAAALRALADDADLRRTVGEANRRKAMAEYDERVMISRYAALYGEAIGRPRAFEAAAEAATTEV